ncbi:HEAT repeat domain-containing protein [Kamptonema formosum]|uniref:HEAT repeat domain-containing protein n=1 Tax=Kamptonema formosum TaxID=331992 RepID=UPI000346ED2E|nr:HEAT repeat domain-containing protein [Oscillatoria sp. PCC 10802]
MPVAANSLIAQTRNLPFPEASGLAGLQKDRTAAAKTEEQPHRAADLPARQATLLAQTETAPTPNPSKKKSGFPIKWVLLGLGAVAVIAVAGGLFYLLIRSGHSDEDLEPESLSEEASPDESENASPQETDGNSATREQYAESNGSREPAFSAPEPKKEEKPPAPPPPDALAVRETTRLAKIDIIDELVKELRSRDPATRRKAIWDLGQRGDSRAVQPLVNLMIDSDSKQRGLILAALSEIGTRTLTPLSRALAVSLQDDSPEVRKNAIRDLTRIYDSLAQISQLLRHAADDPDPEVRETARWAFGQLERIRIPPGAENRPNLPNSDKPPDKSPWES